MQDVPPPHMENHFGYMTSLSTLELKGLSKMAFKQWHSKSENTAIMESLCFDVTAPLPDGRRKFKNGLLLRSVRSGQPELSLSQLLTFLGNL
jgi:hypothetical protein